MACVPRLRPGAEPLKFFAHLRKAGCKVDHGGESPQHLAMKGALKDCIDLVPGWHAIVEYPHRSREWIIDVLAESDDLTRKVAFEVQLSSQTPDKYFARSQRYFDSGIFPVWLVPRRLEYHETKVPRAGGLAHRSNRKRRGLRPSVRDLKQSSRTSRT